MFVSSVEALQSNPPTTFYKNANYFKRFKGKSEDTVGDMFKKRNVKFMTFSQLAHFLLIDKPLKSVKTEAAKEYHRTYLSNAVLIIDEVQNIFHPLPNQRTEHNALKKFLLDENSKLNRNMKVFILTATPGDSVEETIDLLNMVRNRKNKKIEIPNYKFVITSLKVPLVCKSISDELPSAFKKGIVKEDAVPKVTVSVEASPVIVTKPD